MATCDVGNKGLTRRAITPLRGRAPPPCSQAYDRRGCTQDRASKVMRRGHCLWNAPGSSWWTLASFLEVTTSTEIGDSGCFAIALLNGACLWYCRT
ncbi:hypothetical protein BD779DRAFT_1540671 [Infundibulicybe gibba]|nr:hypothetical protein BD779DRAFT_1540671 [Infundibulicybe gibba]